MKTNVIMTRKLNQFDVFQRTSDGMFNATSLLNEWNKVPGNPQRELKKFWEQDGVKSFIEIMISEENLHGAVEAYVKSKASRGENAGTWMHPILFIKFAMWLNPRFEYHVIKFVHNELIKHRHSAGDNYNALCSALSKFDDVDYREIGKILNYVIFNEHERGKRNIATPEQENDLQQLERDVIKFIELGFVNSFSDFKKVMRKEWTKRHANVPELIT